MDAQTFFYAALHIAETAASPEEARAAIEALADGAGEEGDDDEEQE